MFLDLADRKILPRWRDFQTTAALGELDSTSAGRMNAVEFSSLPDRLRDFSENPVPWVAADLVSAAFVSGKYEHALKAAEYLVNNKAISPPASLVLARRILNPLGGEWVVPEVGDEADAALHRRIHLARNRLREESRNSILWVELARLYTIMGETDRAERAIRVACALSPSNRFVLRAATRLFSHLRTPEAALKILRGASSVRKDPWLLAAEIGVAAVAGSHSRLAKIGFGMLEDGNLSAASTTELASALATLEMVEGYTKKARKYFRRSLNSPTENSVAQAEWASRLLGGMEVDVGAFRVPRPFEAQALETFNNGEWEKSVEWSRRWHQDQPFSARPAILASYVSSGTLENYTESIRIIRSSLTANPGDPPLLNNLAFALASMGKTEEAEAAISGLDPTQFSAPTNITLLATSGLILFRKGVVERGRQLYRGAMELARQKGIPNYRAMAAAYLAREEILAGTKEAPRALRRAINAAQGQEAPDVVEILNRVKRLARSQTQSGASPVGGRKKK